MSSASSQKSFAQRLLALICEPSFVKLLNILNEPNFFRIVGRTHYERWHSCFIGWLLDPNGSHLLGDYVLHRLILLLFDDKTLRAANYDYQSLLSVLPTVEFKSVEVAPNEHLSTEKSVNGVGRFDVYLSANYESSGGGGRMNVLIELKIDSKARADQSAKYADWLLQTHPNDLNLLFYFTPILLSDAKATVGDERWFCADYQQLNDRVLLPLLDHPNLNEKVRPFIVQYIKNLKLRHNGVKMAITDEEKRLALELYEKYSDVFDSIYDALQEVSRIDYSTSDIEGRGRKSGKMAVNINGKLFQADTVRLLFRQVLEYLVDQNMIERQPLPWGPTQTRYLLTNEKSPVHPSGKDFFYPESYKGYTIESHYARDRAVQVLDQLCTWLELDFQTVEV